MTPMVARTSLAGSLFALLALGCTESEQTPEVNATGVGRIVYAVRQHTAIDGSGAPRIDVAGGMGQVMDYGRYVPGGRLEILDLASGDVKNVIADYPLADVSSVDVSFDAKKVLFTMKRDPNDDYHVYWAPLEPSADGTFEVTQLTFGPYDDQNAIFAAGGRIVFATNQPYTEMGTRADEYNHSRVVTQLASITLDGGDADRKLCSQNLSHTVTLFPLKDGRVGFSRWEHLENVNDVKLFAMNPDCTQMVALGGQHGKPGNSIVQVVESNTPNVFFGIVTERENTIQAGALVQLDARSAVDPARFDEEKSEAEAYTLLTPAVPTGDEPSADGIGRYRAPSALPNGDVLVSWADGPVNELNELIHTPPDYGVYVFDMQRRRPQLVKNYVDSWELYAKPIVEREEPPILSPRQDTVDASTPTTFGSIDVRATSLGTKHGERVSGAQFENTPIEEALTHAVKVRIIEGFSSEAAQQTMFGLTMAEGAALLGEATVHADGSWRADIPPYIPVHLQPIDEFDLAIRNQTTWIQGMPGEGRICGGCHEDRSRPNDTASQQLTIAAGKPPENFMMPVAERVEYPWAYADDPGNENEIQKILDARCVSCHNETTNGDQPQQFYSVTLMDEETDTEAVYELPRLDLSSREITVTYDNETRAWPASYVSLFYPAALRMGMVEDSAVEGTMPPPWAIPSDARNSAVIEKLNVTSWQEPSRYAWALGEPFSNPDIAGGTRTDHAAVAGLTREELQKLIRAIDMGGQFYARTNTAFQPFEADPVSAQ
ncbi:MAG TPA: hypothetical protein VKY73_01865 [Polyangiaceae bacterium]|nr:hypothetical protein [Polyangiaceae bacterium]